ncbi:hypothetical protein M422DRAFT_246289 [Sphaerobolus stellatus SS14]|nr:hypothetical protein M422DRAFT_246289 [Sphaerobolus stellatus SS14]
MSWASKIFLIFFWEENLSLLPVSAPTISEISKFLEVIRHRNLTHLGRLLALKFLNIQHRGNKLIKLAATTIPSLAYIELYHTEWTLWVEILRNPEGTYTGYRPVQSCGDHFWELHDIFFIGFPFTAFKDDIVERDLDVTPVETLRGLTGLTAAISKMDLQLLHNLRSIQETSAQIALSHLSAFVDGIPNFTRFRLQIVVISDNDETGVFKFPLDTIAVEIAKLTVLKYFRLDGWGFPIDGHDLASSIVAFAERTTLEYICKCDARIGGVWPWYRVLRDSQGTYRGHKKMRNQRAARYDEFEVAFDDSTL